MISVEQIRLLEERVLGVVARLNELRNENRTLRESLGTYQNRIDELESRVQGYTDSQVEIEKGILNALKRLDELEDEVTDTGSTEEESEPVDPIESEQASESSEEVVVETDDDIRTGPELDIF